MSEQILARVPKGLWAEVRVSRQKYKGREVIHIRVWETPGTGTQDSEKAPTRRGVTFDASKMPELLAALREHFPDTSRDTP